MDNKPRINQTDETYVPLSRGLAEHLKNLSGNQVKIYILLLIRAAFQGPLKGRVAMSFKELGLELNMHHVTAFNECKELKEMGYIDWIPASNQWKETVFIIQRYKSIGDFNVIHKYKNKKNALSPQTKAPANSRLTAGQQQANSTPANTNRIKDLQIPKNDNNVENDKNVIKTADDLFISSCKTRNEKLAALLEDLGIRAPDIFIKRWCEGLKARGGRCYDPDVCLRDFKEMCDRIKPHCKEVENIGPYVERSIKNNLEGNGPGRNSNDGKG
ncbi:MAG: hypothetical protein PHC68_07195 [Syntrophorhabdaceae bacterium]|nr:hypothetical protein [Syntrophorhabdaceae bacterium]